MGKFENIQPKDISVWINAVTNRIEAKVWQDGEFHEVAFPVGKHLNMQEMIDSLKKNLREADS